jgi:hypothetical protein
MFSRMLINSACVRLTDMTIQGTVGRTCSSSGLISNASVYDFIFFGVTVFRVINLSDEQRLYNANVLPLHGIHHWFYLALFWYIREEVGRKKMPY